MAPTTVKWWDEISFGEGTLVSAAVETINLQLFELKIPDPVLVTASCHDWIQLWRERGIPVFCLEEETGEVPLSTNALLQHPRVTAFLDDLPPPVYILHFKPSASLEAYCQSRGYRLLNPPASVARPLENKLKFPEIVSDAGIPGIPSHIYKPDPEQCPTEVKAGLEFPVVCQFARGFSGNKTFCISDRDQWRTLFRKFPDKRCKITPYYNGNTWTGNGCVLHTGKIILSEPFLQLTHVLPGKDGLPPTIGSVGNLWVTPKNTDGFKAVVAGMGRVLHQRGYRGLFGADLLLRTEDETWHTVEVNPRLVASLPVLTPLEITSGRIPLLAFHMDQFLNQNLCQEIPGKPLPHVGQLIFRQHVRHEIGFHGKIRSGLYKIVSDNLVRYSPGWSAGDLRDGLCLIWQTSNQTGAGEWIRIILRGETNVPPENLYAIWKKRLVNLVRGQ